MEGTYTQQQETSELEGTDVTFYMVGETFTGDPDLIAYYVNSGMLHGQFDFPSNLAIRQALATDALPPPPPTDCTTAPRALSPWV